jgi:hypothetical protein
MRFRAGSPIIGIIVLLVVGTVFAVSAYVWTLVGPSEEPQTYRLEISAVFQVSDVSVVDARWRVALIVNNVGDSEVIVDKIFVNGELVEEFGVCEGGSLSGKSSIATSIPEGGLRLPVGAKETVYLWIGGGAYSSGTVINIELQRTGQVELLRTITLS